ncbi:Tetratricopeptide repeat protein 6 [Pteropus alecto]|uniref:Tetratricopeptide repeat protein 6 n=1 Tax=Pteropus alecto TaxID=9402 RepID=L5KL68_PTEAL|nr:Tetratricopeptide repeat protein 6 [Pteropus alecto]
MPNQFSEISGNREMEVSGRPNRTSSGQLMSSVIKTFWYIYVFQQNVLEELPENITSIFQIEQEDMLEWTPSEAENMVFTPQETLEIQPADESSKPLEDEQPKSDMKAAKRLSLKVKERGAKDGSSVSYLKEERSRIPQDDATCNLHDLCTTVPAQKLPIDLCLASRVYHTADKKGHNTLLGIFGDAFLDGYFTDEDQRNRILQGIPAIDDKQAYVPTPEIPPELAQGTRQHAQEPYLQLLGEEVPAYPGFTKLFWNLTSPKFSVPVSVMKETLYPKYESVQASRILIEKFSSESKESVITLNQHSRRGLRRVKSAVELREETIVPLEIKDNMQNNIKEVMFQKAKELERRQMVELNETEEPIVKENIDTILDTIQDNYSVTDLPVSLVEASKKAGISYIVYPKKKRIKWKKGWKLRRVTMVLEELSKSPKILKRSMSHGILPGQKKYFLKIPLYERPFQSPSLPSCLNFDKFAQSRGGIPENTDPQTWVVDLFSKHKPQKTTAREKVVKIFVPKDLSEEVKEPPKLELSDSLTSSLPPDVIKHYESEVKILTEEINHKKIYPAFLYCRRGAIYRKLGKLQSAMNDLQECIFYDPQRIDALLKRGLFFYENENWNAAIQDFTALLNVDPQNSQARTVTFAYINIGLIYLRHLDNYIEATWHFSEAIRLDPLYIRSYICRAEIYHKLHELKKAVRELSYAIHLQPDGIQLYIIRGQYLLMMKCYDLAKFTIYQVAEMNKGHIELSPIQQALIYSFCENHDKAIQVLDGIILNRPEITTYTLLAKSQMKAKRSKAFDCFTKAVKANPDLAEGFYQRGLCKVKLRKDSSILDFNRAITLDPKYYEAYLSRVAFYGLKGRYSKAILNCNEAIRIYPQSVRAYIYRGVLKYYNKTYKLAITDLTTAINMDKNSYVAFYNRALCYTRIGELRMALTDYGIVLLLDAGETVTLNTFINRGLIYEELEQYSFALEDFKQAALISKTNVGLCQATAMCYYRNKEFEEAVDFFTWAININPCFLDAYVGRGNSYMEYGHDEATKQAQKDFLRALHFDPTYIKARISLGYNLQAQEKFQKAWHHFTIAIEVDPKSYLAYEGRAVVCLQMSDNFAAMQDINTAIKINTTAEFLTNRGVIHEFMGQQQNAMKDYQAAVSLNPTYSLAYFNAGNIYLHHRQFSQASDYFSKALKFDPENKCAMMNRAIANTILKKYEDAREDFANVVENCPFWAAVYFNRAQLYCCLKQYELAEEDLSKALSLKPNDALVYNLRAEVRGKLGVIEEAMADYNQALDLQDHVQ